MRLTVAFLVFMFCLCFSTGWTQEQPGDTPTLNASATQLDNPEWEYADFSFMKVSPPAPCFWNGPNGDLSADSLYELYTKISGMHTDRNQFAVSTLLTYLGKQGWELVDTNNKPGYATYRFKRIRTNTPSE